jgi:hypothetical protein
MARIEEATIAQVRTPELAETMRAAFRAYRDADGDVRWPMHGKIGDITIKRDVIATLHERGPVLRRVIYDIAFAPAAGGPTFTGILTATSDTIGTCRLAISGTYRPPLGIAGALFDAVLGHRVREETLHKNATFEYCDMPSRPSSSKRSPIHSVSKSSMS